MLASLCFISMLVAMTFGCPDGYTFYSGDNTCLKSFDTGKRFSDARQTCKKDGGDLVQVRDAKKSTFVGGVHARTYWMGVWDSDKDRKFSYVDGTPVGNYQPWRAGEPNNGGGREYCVFVVSKFNKFRGQWNDAACYTKLPFVCEVKVECSDGYQLYSIDGKCLKGYDVKKNYNDARKVCQDDGGDLVQVQDASKARFVGDIHTKTYWMGVRDSDRNQQFAYLDGTPLGSYKPWNTGEPNNSRNSEFCVLVLSSMARNGGKWNDGNCNDSLTFVCEK